MALARHQGHGERRPSSHKGRSRTETKAGDHDFKPEATRTPIEVFAPQHDDPTRYVARSKVTGNFIVDRLRDWRESDKVRWLMRPDRWDPTGRIGHARAGTGRIGFVS